MFWRIIRPNEMLYTREFHWIGYREVRMLFCVVHRSVSLAVFKPTLKVHAMYSGVTILWKTLLCNEGVVDILFEGKCWDVE